MISVSIVSVICKSLQISVTLVFRYRAVVILYNRHSSPQRGPLGPPCAYLFQTNFYGGLVLQPCGIGGHVVVEWTIYRHRHLVEAWGNIS